ncbi:MAG: CDP-diacylglycerol--glycerol-3-phosphate 3-phosphatidyltransferase [Solobacterium sp.]|nr:CDP-diacylglycerol--glycerol-3-phosphate 3-phosphatidyltransferase [Solobacterium sp.]MBQ1446895.1 CDP-diacylglycerol--glycerol-3-phosphate 3-phosphatidyltransferase [Solobacterium sp.]MBR2727057.1 CDP-diacylglycerol--glycerol-3-phosphate 3-phosphatidyltransferase [Solobacterium sp.]
MNLPNRLTVMRIVLIPLIVLIYIFPYAQFGIVLPVLRVGTVNLPVLNLVVLAVYLIAAFTDLLDGKIARKYNLQTTFGKFADPIADKMLTTTMFLIFAAKGIIPVVPVIIMVCRDIIVDGCRMIAAGNGKVVSAQMMGKLKTVLQMAAIALVLLNNLPFELWRLPVSVMMVWFAAFISMASGWSYFSQLKDDIFESK